MSSCAALVTGLYLEDPVGNAPAIDGFVCPSEGNWFDKFAGNVDAAGLNSSIHAQFMEQIALRP